MIPFILAGLFAGVLSGLLGIGGGIILVPIMVYILNMPIQVATGTSLIALLLPVGALGVMNYYQAGKLTTDNFKFGFLMALGLFVGAYFGSKLGLVLPERAIKMVFGIFLIGVGIKFCV